MVFQFRSPWEDECNGTVESSLPVMPALYIFPKKGIASIFLQVSVRKPSKCEIVQATRDLIAFAGEHFRQ